MAQGATATVGWGFETVAAQQKATTFYGLRWASLMFSPDPTISATRNVQSRPMALKGRLDEMRLPWSVDFDPDVDSVARLLAHQNGFVAITNPAAGVYDWTIRDLLSTDSLASDISSLSIDGNRDDGYNTLLLGAAVRDFEIKVQRNKIAQAKFSGSACHFTHMKDATMTTTGGTYTGKLHIRGNRMDTDAEDTTNHLKVKCTTAGALNGAAKVKCTKGATAYGSVEIAITAGVWYPFTLADGTNASGDPYNPVEFMLSAGGTLSLNDEFEVQAKRTTPTFTYPTRQPLHANGLIVTIGGTAYPVENFDLKFTAPRKEQRGSGSAYPTAMLRDGKRAFSISIQRDYVTRALYLKMLSANAVSFDATFNGDFIATVASASYFEKLQFASTNAQIFKAGGNPTSDKYLTEAVEVVPYFDGTNVDLSTVVRCTLATLT
jgi:hypothetical protein